MIDFRIRLVGTTAMLMHSDRTVNSIDPMTKAIKQVTGKRKKTDDDYEEMARLEHAAGLYMDPEVGPYIPGENISSCLVGAAKITRQGTYVKQGVLITTDINPLGYKGPRTIDGLWKDENFRHMKSVKVTTSRVMRCRPIFQQWTVEADGILDPEIIDFLSLQQIAETAGHRIGIGDWRPRFGRFAATVERI